MADTDEFLKRMLGYRDIRANDGSLLARRNKMFILGGDVEDVDGETHISLSAKVSWLSPSAEISSDQDDFSPTDFNILTDIAVTPLSIARTINGFDADNLAVYTKRVWNTSNTINLIIGSNVSSSLPNNRVVTPTGVDVAITPGNFARIIRNATDTGWRMVT